MSGRSPDSPSDAVDLLVVGGGPAGLSAAAAAADAGARVLLVDENPELGGQYLRTLPTSWSDEATWAIRTRAHRDALIRDVTRTAVMVVAESSVFDLAPAGLAQGYRAGIQSRSTSEVRWVEARCVVVAAGAYEAVMPFPGWTLPGVMTIGGAQNLAKSQGLPPGARVVLSGAGPFLWLVADNLIRRGSNVVAVVDATPLAASLRFALRARTRAPLAIEAAAHWLRILRHSRFFFGRAAVSAEGDGRVERVTLARIDARSRVLATDPITLRTDALCTSYGLVPCTEVTRLVGCEHRRDPLSGTSVPVVNDRLETSSPGLFAAGETLGVGGWQAAEQEGRVAGTAVANKLGLISDARVRDVISAHAHMIGSHRSFTREMLSTYRLGRGALSWAHDATIACRCEEVTVETVRRAIQFGDRSADAIKSRTRVGMGRCQGRVCGIGVQTMLADALGVAELPAPFGVRPPLRPVTISNLIQATEHHVGEA
jgi:NADPH-dependent 2,4-dienoyl-CoA reductase/sulfur reductase-like enzyme